MNIENANILLNWLRAGAPHAKIDMDYAVIDPQDWVNDERVVAVGGREVEPECGTVCCIAGAADQMKIGGGMFPPIAVYDRDVAHGGSKDWDAVGTNALDWLGLKRLTWDQAEKLWGEGFGSDYDDSMFHPLFDPSLAPEDCTPDQAADALERTMRGEFPWPDAL